ncbi:MAG: putative coiled-coil protein SlyX [Saprospiraceae bacterium]|jgi:uncharacterized coiled-coil protein SlyX|tara:strand:+ start:733 stop:1395 length:663 start_codon:yes stop_codon:yes gene_type:complete
MTDDNFSGVGSIVPESDERIGRGKAYVDRGSSNSRGPGNPAIFFRGRGVGLYKLFVVGLMISLGGLSYLLVAQGSDVASLEDRFSGLEANVVSSNVSAELKEQESRLDEHWSEIKKLWAIAYDRNTKNIKKQEKTIKNLKGLVANQKKELASITGKLSAVMNASLATKLELNDLTSKTGSPSAQGLEVRVSDNEKAIKAIDAHRISVNRDMQQLKSQLTR